MRPAAALVCVAVVAGCGGNADQPPAAEHPSPTRQSTATHEPNPPAPNPNPKLHQPRCPPSASNCSEASGRIIYVERVDPDGDGDAHFVLASRESITAPGISVIDVRVDLRPHPLPGVGDELAAEGPVYRGSYGQHQIQADAVAVAR